MGRVCPRCGRAIPRGSVHRCPMAPGPSRNKARERERRDRETWRGGYSTREYQSARKRALERSDGRCEVCGTPVFDRTGRGWRRVSRDYGGTHHVIPLSGGGSNSEGNVVVLCARCHGLAHSKRCKGSASIGELLTRIRGEL